jgi:hypothetical protein
MDREQIDPRIYDLYDEYCLAVWGVVNSSTVLRLKPEPRPQRARHQCASIVGLARAVASAALFRRGKQSRGGRDG